MRGLARHSVIVILVGCALGLASGCAARTEKPKLSITRVIFKDCKVTEPGHCECVNIAWAIDAKTGNPVALCGAKKK